MRREFSNYTKAQAALRSNGLCEGCGVRLTTGHYHYDHVVPDQLGGEPTLENCAVLCKPCHGEKTAKRDVPAIAKAKRRQRKHLGIKKRSTFACSRDSKFKKKINGEVVLR
jgi:5-methylcytosine-specific restriction protein A